MIKAKDHIENSVNEDGETHWENTEAEDETQMGMRYVNGKALL